MKTFVIGDVHGHYDRLRDLLHQEGIINEQGERIDFDVEVVQLGDLGHFGEGGSPTGDFLCYKDAQTWIDIILWGNHDRAVADEAHAYKGFLKPRPEVYHMIMSLWYEGTLRLAHEAHGHLLTHAGLHTRFRYNRIAKELGDDPKQLAHWLNDQDALYRDFRNNSYGIEFDKEAWAIRDAIGGRRGGRSPVGGILWRDIDEGLYDEFPQVFGHSADGKKHKVRYCWSKGHTRKIANVPNHVRNVSYCIDIGGKGDRPGDNCLAGIWLPDGRIAEVRG